MIIATMTAPSLPARILIVCTGNICRSPTVEAVLRASISNAQLAIEVDSAATHDYHVNQPVDARSALHAKKRGYDLSELRARQVQESDFGQFDLILAADQTHLDELRRRCPAALQYKLALFLENGSIPDPYYGTPEAFEQVLDLVETRVQSLIFAWQAPG